MVGKVLIGVKWEFLYTTGQLTSDQSPDFQNRSNITIYILYPLDAEPVFFLLRLSINVCQLKPVYWLHVHGHNIWLCNIIKNHFVIILKRWYTTPKIEISKSPKTWVWRTCLQQCEGLKKQRSLYKKYWGKTPHVHSYGNLQHHMVP